MPFLVHMFLADWSYCQVPDLGNLGRMQALVGSYQYLQKAHFFQMGLFSLMFTRVHIRYSFQENLFHIISRLKRNKQSGKNPRFRPVLNCYILKEIFIPCRNYRFFSSSAAALCPLSTAFRKSSLALSRSFGTPRPSL